MDRSLRIALFVPNLHGGGAERVFVNLARAIQPLVASVDLVVGSRTGVYVEQSRGIHVVDLGARRVASAILPLARYLRDQRPTLLMAAMPHANLAAIMAARLAGGRTRVVVSVHADVLQMWRLASRKERIVFLATRLGYRFAHGLIGVSVGTLASERYFLSRAMPPLNRAIYNPILSADEPALPLRHPRVGWPQGEERVIVAAGRLSEQKDFATLLEAFARLPSRSSCRLCIFGEGPLRADLQQMICRLDLADRVSLAGFAPDIRSSFARADLFVSSSRFEGFGNVIVEALASGCPVVSTDCPSGPSEILAGGRFGVLTPVGDPDAMAKAIQSVLEGRGPVFDTKEAVAPYRADVVAREYVRFFERCVGR